MASVVVLILLLVSIRFGTISSDLEEKNLLQDIIESIDQSLNYMKREQLHLTVDALLGIVIVREQSKSLFQILETKSTIINEYNAMKIELLKSQLKKLNKKSNEIIQAAIVEVITNDSHYFNSIGGILDPKIWSKIEYDLRSLNFSSDYGRQTSKSKWNMNEAQSDYCLTEIFDQCQISTGCWNLFIETVHEGFPLAHQVLYLMIARTMGCLNNIEPIMLIDLERKLQSWCSAMFKTNVGIELKQFPDSDRDLFMQNIAFCGYNGFDRFRMEQSWLSTILKWQHLTTGCFGYERKSISFLLKSIKSKRRDRVFVHNGCSLHRTSMALASLSIYLQQMVIDEIRIEQM